jgi:hypothetical protein
LERHRLPESFLALLLWTRIKSAPHVLFGFWPAYFRVFDYSQGKDERAILAEKASVAIAAGPTSAANLKKLRTKEITNVQFQQQFPPRNTIDHRVEFPGQIPTIMDFGAISPPRARGCACAARNR